MGMGSWEPGGEKKKKRENPSPPVRRVEVPKGTFLRVGTPGAGSVIPGGGSGAGREVWGALPTRSRPNPPAARRPSSNPRQLSRFLLPDPAARAQPAGRPLRSPRVGRRARGAGSLPGPGGARSEPGAGAAAEPERAAGTEQQTRPHGAAPRLTTQAPAPRPAAPAAPAPPTPELRGRRGPRPQAPRSTGPAPPTPGCAGPWAVPLSPLATPAAAVPLVPVPSPLCNRLRSLPSFLTWEAYIRTGSCFASNRPSFAPPPNCCHPGRPCQPLSITRTAYSRDLSPGKARGPHSTLHTQPHALPAGLHTG